MVVLIIEDYLKGMSQRELETKYNITRHFIRQILKDNNIPIRNPKEADKIRIYPTREQHANWQGGRHFNKKDSEWKILYKGKYIKEAHYIWCINSGWTFVPKDCDIHHRDLNHLNNEFSNLVLLPHDLHTSLHRRIQTEA